MEMWQEMSENVSEISHFLSSEMVGKLCIQKDWR